MNPITSGNVLCLRFRPTETETDHEMQWANPIMRPAELAAVDRQPAFFWVRLVPTLGAGKARTGYQRY